jgi:hypothetical protein
MHDLGVRAWRALQDEDGHWHPCRIGSLCCESSQFRDFSRLLQMSTTAREFSFSILDFISRNLSFLDIVICG